MQKVAQQTAARAIPPEQVAGLVEHALTARRPQARYLAGADARVQALIARLPAGVTAIGLLAWPCAEGRYMKGCPRMALGVIGVDVGGTKVATALLEDGVLGESVRDRPRRSPPTPWWISSWRPSRSTATPTPSGSESRASSTPHAAWRCPP